jgi:iron complex outermembrane receptor protein
VGNSPFDDWLIGGEGGLRFKVMCCASAAVLFMSGLPAFAQSLAADTGVFNLTLDQLANLPVTSVSKSAEPLSDAPAAVYVISHDEVVQSGATSIADMLRLAPNLEVMQTSPSNYEITARGFDGNSAAQNFSNKLLVLIDGRSVYSPLYSGVYWDMQEVLPEDIERIEVISGPGGTLWGANAVNGVVNIITRDSKQTQGGVLDLSGGDQYASASLQYGGALTDDLSYRIYGTTFMQRAFNTPGGGGNAHDDWTRPQGGFRIDWDASAVDQVNFSGDLYAGSEAQLGAPDQRLSGANLTARWQHQLDGNSSLQLLTYYDESQRSSVDGGGFHLNSYDIELQHNFNLGDWNNIVWGIGERINQYAITDRISTASSLIWDPNSRVLNLVDLFAEDHVPLSDSVQLTLGIKLEDDPYSGITPMPSGRISWKISDDHMVWAAVSRAIRAPTPFDADVEEKLGAVTFLTGNPDFLPEQVTAYEVGYRGQITPDLTVSVSAFQNVYEDLRSIEITPVTELPLTWGNLIKGDVHGVEIWGNWQAIEWWRLSAGFNVQHEDLSFAPGASQLLGLGQTGDDPHHQVSLRSTMNLPYDLTLETDWRDVGALPDPKVPEYVEANARLAWKISDTLSLSLSGFNLLHGEHQEYPTGDLIRRSVLLESRLRF